MLVLTRKQGEKILIGEGADQITVVVSQIKDNKCRLGIEAPKHVKVDREEVRKNKDQEASTSS